MLCLGKLLGIKEELGQENQEKRCVLQSSVNLTVQKENRDQIRVVRIIRIGKGERLAWFIKSDVLLSIRSGTKLSFIEINFPVFFVDLEVEKVNLLIL